MSAGAMVARGRLLPVTSAPVDDGLLLAEGATIAYAGPAARAPRIPADAVELEVGDGTVVPGLVDAHVHLTCDGGPDLAAEVDGRSAEELTVKAVANAVRQLSAGVVAVRDLGAPGPAAVAVGAAVAAGRIDGPVVAAAGQAITAPGGHIPYLGVEVDGREAMAAAARAQLDAGADGLKLVATGGLSTPGVPIGNAAYDEDELAAAATVALQAGGWVAAHCIGLEGTKRALRAGATSVEHGVFLDEEAVDLMRSRGAVLVPTVLPLRRILEHGADGGVHPEVVAKAETVAERHLDSVRLAAAAGVPIAAGTDAGTAFNPHGALAAEVALLVDHIGLDAERALHAATRGAARCLKRDDLGHLSRGAPANLAVVAGHPLDDPSSLTTVRHVLVGGRTVTPGGLLRPPS